MIGCLAARGGEYGVCKDNVSEPLSVEGLAEPVRTATQGAIDGARAFLSRVCLPVAEELGLALQDRISAWRAGNAIRVLDQANTIHVASDPDPEDVLSPRLAHGAIEAASWVEDDQLQAMWAGLLASSTSLGGRSDENLLFMGILKQLSSLEVSVLRFAVERASKKVGGYGLVISEPLEEIVAADLPGLFGIEDLHRIDRELDHLRELGLIGKMIPFFGRGGGINLTSGMADLTPTPLALNLYVRCQGSKLSPMEFWSLSERQDESTSEGQSSEDLER